MRVLIFAPCLLLFSCNNGDDNPKENTNHFDSSVVKVDHNQKINDLQVEMDSIQPLLDSLNEGSFHSSHMPANAKGLCLFRM